MFAAHAELRHPGHSPQSVHAGKLSGALKSMAEPDGGFTIDRDGKPITTGWSVALSGSTSKLVASQISTDRPAARKAIADKLNDVPDDASGIGGWHEPATGTVHIDVVKVFPSSQKAAAVQFGKDNNQISIANLDAIARGDDANSFVDTGGTGDRSASITDHGTHTTFHVQVRQAAEHDVRAGASRSGRQDPRPVGGGSEGSSPDPNEVDIRHATHNQKDHGGGGGSAADVARQGLPASDFDGPVVMRGISMKLSAGQIEALKPASSMAEYQEEYDKGGLARHTSVGESIVKDAASFGGHDGSQSTKGIGRSWTTDTDLIDGIAVSGGETLVRFTAKPRTSDIIASNVKGKEFGLDTGAAMDMMGGESEVRLKGGAPVDIVNVEIRNPYPGEKWLQVWAAPTESRHASHDQKTHGRGGGGGGYNVGVRSDGTLEVSGFGSLDSAVQEKLTKKLDQTFGGPGGEQIMVDNYLSVAQELVVAGGLDVNLKNAKWYSEEHDAAQANVDATNAGSVDGAPEMTSGKYFAMASVTSANKGWDENKAFVDDWSNTMSKDPTVTVTSDMVADYNQHVGNTRQSVNQQHDLPAGDYKLSQLPADMVMPMSRHDTNRQALADQGFKTPGLRNFNDGTKMMMIARGDGSPEAIGSIIKGPKQRSFYNNLEHPNRPGDVTHDIWDYRAAAGTTPITLGKNGTQTMAEWESDTRFVTKTGKIGKSPQDLLQSGPGYTKDKVTVWDSSNGVYPITTSASTKATSAFNKINGTNLMPHEFQAMIWVGMGGNA